MPRAARRCAIQRLPHLPDAGGFYGESRERSLRYGASGFKPKKRAQPLQCRLGVAHQRIVVEVEDIGREHALPVCHEPAILAEIMSDILEVEGIAHLLI